jgi:hypothetical protein
VCLAKKAASHPPAVVDAQNLLVHIQGLISGSSTKASDFEQCIKIFVKGLTEVQAKQIDDLLMAQVSPSTPVDEVSY